MAARAWHRCVLRRGFRAARLTHKLARDYGGQPDRPAADRRLVRPAGSGDPVAGRRAGGVRAGRFRRGAHDAMARA